MCVGQLPVESTDPCIGDALVTAPAGGKHRVLARGKKASKVAFKVKLKQK